LTKLLIDILVVSKTHRLTR